MDVLKVPCNVLGLHVHSMSPSSKNNIDMNHLWPNGSTTPFTEGNTLEAATAAFEQRRGCRVIASLRHDYRMQGFGFIWTHEDWLPMIFSKVANTSLDMSHKINYFYLGAKSTHDFLEKYH